MLTTTNNNKLMHDFSLWIYFLFEFPSALMKYDRSSSYEYFKPKFMEAVLFGLIIKMV